MTLQQRLDSEFTVTELILAPDDEGANVATLVHAHANTGRNEAVLYIHGVVDYFFHPHVSDAFIAENIDFYALDLRKYGRSLRPHQSPNYCRSLADYFEEITLAIESMIDNGAQKVYLLAHSTGAPTACLYANQGRRKDDIAAMILNAPFLDIPHLSRWQVNSIYAISKLVTHWFPYAQLPQRVNPVYAHTLHIQFGGEWDYNLALKPERGFGVYLAWALAVVDAQRWLRAHSDLDMPILAMHSARYSNEPELTEQSYCSDIVLDVDQIKRDAPLLGSDVTLCAIDGALHDIFLSPYAIRATAMESMFAWLNSKRACIN